MPEEITNNEEAVTEPEGDFQWFVVHTLSGQERKVEAFIELMRPYGIVELSRTGRIAMVRGTPGG